MNRLTKRVDFIQDYLDAVFSEDLHAKRVKSLTNGTLGVMTSASLAVSIIGQSLAQARGLLSKHAIKQVDRLLSNQGIIVWDMFAPWVAESRWPAEGNRRRHGLDRFRRRRSDDAGFEPCHQPRPSDAFGVADRLEGRVERTGATTTRTSALPGWREVLPEGVAVTILADRGFGDTKLFDFLETLGFAYVIRFRGNIHVTAADGETRAAAAWVGKGGRARKLRDAEVTAARHKVGAVVCVKAKEMKEAWCLAASNAEATARADRELLRQTLDDRTRVSRHQGSSFRHGFKRASHRRSATTRQASSPERLRHRAPDAARRRRRKPRHGPPSQGQHRQTPHPFSVSAGLHALRVDPEHAGHPLTATR